MPEAVSAAAAGEQAIEGGIKAVNTAWNKYAPSRQTTKNTKKLQKIVADVEERLDAGRVSDYDGELSIISDAMKSTKLNYKAARTQFFHNPAKKLGQSVGASYYRGRASHRNRDRDSAEAAKEIYKKANKVKKRLKGRPPSPPGRRPDNLDDWEDESEDYEEHEDNQRGAGSSSSTGGHAWPVVVHQGRGDPYAMPPGQSGHWGRGGTPYSGVAGRGGYQHSYGHSQPGGGTGHAAAPYGVQYSETAAPHGGHPHGAQGMSAYTQYQPTMLQGMPPAAMNPTAAPPYIAHGHAGFPQAQAMQPLQGAPGYPPQYAYDPYQQPGSSSGGTGYYYASHSPDAGGRY